RSHGLLQRLQHRQKDGGARRGGKLRASAHAVSGQVLRHKTSRRVFPDGLRGDQDDRLLQRCPARGPMGPAMFCLALRPGLKRFRQEFEEEGVEAFAYMDDVSLGLTGITANTVRAFAFLRRELDDIGIVVNAAKTVALPPKG
ncbi:unnamed protein product, partial [Laminaria digitata]